MPKKTPDYDNVFKTMKSKHKRLFISVIYIKKTARTPKTTAITFVFPNGQKVEYQSDNILLEELTKEEMINRTLFPYIPFYLARYEKELTAESGNIEEAVQDLSYLRDEMLRLHQEGELSDSELVGSKRA